MKYRLPALSKIEKMLEEAHYVIRYERGSFQSGYCILEDRQVIVLNKFLQTEGRINTLTALLPLLKIEAGLLSPDSQKIHEALMEENLADRRP